MPAAPPLIVRVIAHPRTALAVVVAILLVCWVWVAAMARDMYGSMMGSCDVGAPTSPYD